MFSNYFFYFLSCSRFSFTRFFFALYLSVCVHSLELLLLLLHSPFTPTQKAKTRCEFEYFQEILPILMNINVYCESFCGIYLFSFSHTNVHMLSLCLSFSIDIMIVDLMRLQFFSSCNSLSLSLFYIFLKLRMKVELVQFKLIFFLSSHALISRV